MELEQFFYFLDVLFVSYVQRFDTSVEFPNLSGERPNETDKHDYLMPVAPNNFIHCIYRLQSTALYLAHQWHP